MATNKEVYAKVMGAVIEAMEKGKAPWVKPWKGGTDLAMPYNALTGRPYNGGNILALWMSGYEHNGWCTFKQALEAGCVVRKGEKATPVFYMRTMVKRAKDEDEDDQKMFLARMYFVFNVEQLTDREGKDGALEKLKAKWARKNEELDAKGKRIPAHKRAEKVVAATGAKIAHGGDKACYIPASDSIRMPKRETFTKRDEYYGVLFHELTHWTGARERLNRGMGRFFGSPEYAFEELVAELGACFSTARLGMKHVDQSAAYIKSWATACRQHPDLLVSAASHASRAAGFIFKDQPEGEREADESAA